MKEDWRARTRELQMPHISMMDTFLRSDVTFHIWHNKLKSSFGAHKFCVYLSFFFGVYSLIPSIYNALSSCFVLRIVSIGTVLGSNLMFMPSLRKVNTRYYMPLRNTFDKIKSKTICENKTSDPRSKNSAI